MQRKLRAKEIQNIWHVGVSMWPLHLNPDIFIQILTSSFENHHDVFLTSSSKYWHLYLIPTSLLKFWPLHLNLELWTDLLWLKWYPPFLLLKKDKVTFLNTHYCEYSFENIHVCLPYVGPAMQRKLGSEQSPQKACAVNPGPFIIAFTLYYSITLSLFRAFTLSRFHMNNWQVNLLSVILNDAPILPEEDDEDVALLVKDSPQCMTFGLFMIWWVLRTRIVGK